MLGSLWQQIVSIMGPTAYLLLGVAYLLVGNAVLWTWHRQVYGTPSVGSAAKTLSLWPLTAWHTAFRAWQVHRGRFARTVRVVVQEPALDGKEPLQRRVCCIIGCKASFEDVEQLMATLAALEPALV